jgi:TolA-binding protein
MSGTPPQIQMTQSGQGSLVAIITGAAAILITQLGTSFSSQAGVSAVKENQLLLLQEVKEVSNANRALNEKIVRLSEENQRLNEKEIEMQKQAEFRQTEILKRLEKLK